MKSNEQGCWEVLGDGVNMIKIHHIKFSKKYKVLSVKHVNKLNKIKMSQKEHVLPDWIILLLEDMSY